MGQCSKNEYNCIGRRMGQFCHYNFIGVFRDNLTLPNAPLVECGVRFGHFHNIVIRPSLTWIYQLSYMIVSVLSNQST